MKDISVSALEKERQDKICHTSRHGSDLWMSANSKPVVDFLLYEAVNESRRQQRCPISYRRWTRLEHRL